MNTPLLGVGPLTQAQQCELEAIPPIVSAQSTSETTVSRLTERTTCMHHPATGASDNELLSLEDFAQWMASTLALTSCPRPEDRLGTDLGLDQFHLVLLVLHLDMLGTSTGPTIETVHLGSCSVRDLYLYYLLKQQLPPAQLGGLGEKRVL